MSLRRYFSCVSGLCLLISASLASQVLSAPPTQGGSIHGLVKSGNMPLPGATITATNKATAQKVITWTDVDGNFALQVPEDGHYEVRAQMAAFAVGTQEVIIGPANRDAPVNIELVLLSRVPSALPVAPGQPARCRAAK